VNRGSPSRSAATFYREKSVAYTSGVETKEGHMTNSKSRLPELIAIGLAGVFLYSLAMKLGACAAQHTYLCGINDCQLYAPDGTPVINFSPVESITEAHLGQDYSQYGYSSDFGKF
jgi:hypothetical protein